MYTKDVAMSQIKNNKHTFTNSEKIAVAVFRQSSFTNFLTNLRLKTTVKRQVASIFYRGDVVMKTNNTSRRASCWIPEGGGWWTRILEPWLDRPGPKRCQNRRQPCQWWLLFFCACPRLVGESLAIEFWQFPGEEYKYCIYILYVYISVYIRCLIVFSVCLKL